MSDAEHTTRRLRLREAGFAPIPVGGKVPALTAWQTKLDTTPDEIRLWESLFSYDRSTGILTRHTPTLDLDILNEEAVRAIEDHVREQYEERGYVLVRIGKPPKRAIPFWTDKPFTKITANVTAANGSAEKIEFLADGQQVVVAGIHPETKEPYRWHGGKLGEIAREDLPYILEDDAHRLVDTCVDLLVRDFGYTRAPERPGKRDKGNGADREGGAGAADWQHLISNIREGRELHDSLRDLAAKLIISGTSAGAAVNQLRALMNDSAAPRDDRWRARYDEIPRLVTSAESLRQEKRSEGSDERRAVRLEDFRAYMPQHLYIFTPAREMWPAASVNARLSPAPLLDTNGRPVLDANGEPKFVRASLWLDRHRPVEQTTWAPGEPMLIQGRLISEGGWIERPGCTVFNLYRPPTLVPGDATRAGPWLDHVRRVYPHEADHIIRWLAQRVQHPETKVNHALVLGGLQGIGKDTLIEPVKRAVGPWNVSEVSPQQLLGRFNGFVKSVILRISEARDLGDVDRYSFYDHLKAFTAAPPDVLRCDEKNLREHSVLNCCGVILTSNHKADGIYLPADDRRHFVAWSDLSKDDFAEDYWKKLWSWYAEGGDRHVAAYLAQLDLSGFDVKAPPPKTAAFWDIVDASRAPEDAELADVLDRLGNPDATTLLSVQNKATGDFETWIRERKNRRQVPYRFEQCGYVPVRNDAATSGLWVINKVRQVIYAKASLTPRDRLAAARKLASPQEQSDMFAAGRRRSPAG